MLTAGRLYLIRGGHIVRHNPGGPPYFEAADVIREMTASDARWLRVRLVSLLARKMRAEADWVKEVMREVGLEIPEYVPRLFPGETR